MAEPRATSSNDDRTTAVVRPTPLQRAILAAKVGGLTDASIARALKISERTVRRQLDLLTDLLGVSGRAGLYLDVGRRGWLDGDESESSRRGDVAQPPPRTEPHRRNR